MKGWMEHQQDAQPTNVASQLRDIFRLHLDTRCLSHDQMGCSCQGSGIPGARMEGGEEPEGDEEEEEETDHPPATFVKASQVQADQEYENEKTKKGKLAALLRWAHHDCMSAQSAETEDAIINAIVAQQKKAGIYTDGHDATDGDSFDLTRVKPGSVLFVYAEASEKTPHRAVQG